MSASRELLEMRFKRFLHYGSEQPIYRAGDRALNKCFGLDKIPSLIKLINDQIYQSVVEIITKVVKEESSLWPDSVTYALAYCCHQDASRELKNEAYKILRLVCKTARDIILFVKFHREFRGTKGGGNGFKRAVGQWYLVWMPFDLADILLHQKSYHGWKHTDVLRIAHIKPISIEQQVLFTYATRGLKEATTRFGESPNEQVQELLEYVTTVESFRKIKEPEKAARALAVELHNLERVPTNLLKHQEIWNELITHMDVKTLLDNLQRLSILGFLKNNTVTVLKVVDVFNNLWKAETFKGHPSRVYIELLTYEKAAKYCLEIANKMNHPISKMVPAKKPPKCNLVIKSALITFFYSLFKFQKPTGLRYLVAVDVRPKMFSDRCHHSLYLTPIEAATAISISLVRTEPDGNVTIGAYREAKGELELMSFDKTSEIVTYDNAFSQKGITPGPASVASAIHWAETNKRAVDVFLILSNYMVSTSGTRPSINHYRTAMNLPNAKVVTCSLSGNVRTHKDVEGQNMLSVVGFDDKVCRIIEAFARGSF